MNKHYIAGFFDADGYVTMFKNASNEEETAAAGFTNNVRSILEGIQKYILQELGIKGSISLKKARVETHQDSYDLKYQGFKKCITLLNYLPIQHPKKIGRLEILKQLEMVTPKNGKYLPEVLIIRRKMCKKFLETKG